MYRKQHLKVELMKGSGYHKSVLMMLLVKFWSNKC